MDRGASSDRNQLITEKRDDIMAVGQGENFDNI